MQAKTIDLAFSAFWQNRIAETGAFRDVAHPAIMLSFNGLCLLRNPLLGVLLNVVGLSLISPVVGVYCAASTIVYALVTAGRGEKKDENSAVVDG